MLDTLAVSLLYSMVAASLLFGLANLFRANLYDLRQARLRCEQLRHPHARHRRKRPLVSVVVFAQNDTDNILSCLDSIVRGSYRKHEIIVVDNASRDSTPKVVREFIKSRPRNKATLIAKRRPGSRADAIAQAGKRAKGKMVLVTDACNSFGTSAIKDLVLQANETSAHTIVPNIEIEHGYRLLGLGDQFRSIATLWAKKSGAFILPGLDARNHAALYQREAFMEITKPVNRAAFDNLNRLRKITGYAYDGRALVRSRAPRLDVTLLSSLPGPISLLRGLLSLAEPLVAGFMVYVAIRFDQPGYIALAWLSFTTLLIIAIWSDESRGFMAKVNLSLIAAVSYSIYILDITLNSMRGLWRSFRPALTRA